MSSTPLRIAVDVGPLYGHRTGVGVAVAGVVTALRARDDATVVPYLVSSRSSPNPGDRKLPLPGIAASHLWSRFDRPGADRWLSDVDVVHGTNYVAPPTRHPTVVSVYDCWFLRHPELAAPVVRRAGANLRRAVDRGAWVHACSEATAVEVAGLLRTDRVRTIHLGPPDPPPPRAELGHPPIEATLGGARFVVTVGTEERRKDLPLLIRAFDQLASRVPDVALVLAGTRGDQSDAVTDAIEGLPAGTRGRVHRLGAVDDATKHWLLRQASVLAYPSLDEGFGFPVLEAQTAGTPVVASHVGSVPEIGGDGIELVAERDPDAFAAAIERVLSGVHRLGMIEAGHRNLRRFDWADTADGLVDLYQTVRNS